MRARHILLTLGLAVAAWLALFGDKTPAPDIAEPVARKNTSVGTSPSAGNSQTISASAASAYSSASNNRAAKKAGVTPVILTLIDRDALIGSTRSEKQADQLFTSQSWTPPPPPPPKVVELPPPAPVAPPLPFSFLGKKIEDGKWEVYLTRNDQTFIVRAQTVIENTYRIDAITPPILTLTYLPLNQIQTLTIGGTD